MRAYNPDGVAKPAGPYRHIVAVPASAEWIVIAGQVGVDPAGALPPDAQTQAENCFKNILACLAAEGLGREHIVKLQSFVTDSRFIADWRAARSATLGDDCLPASTLLVVEGLAAPQMLVEVEAWAIKPAG